MSRSHGRLAALLAALFVLGVLAAGCTAVNQAPAPRNQLSTTRLLRADQDSAGHGVLAYRPLPSMTAGMRRRLTVSVTEVGRYGAVSDSLPAAQSTGCTLWVCPGETGHADRRLCRCEDH